MTWFDVQVDPAHRRRGAGTALVERLLERAREEGRVTMVVDFLVPPDSEGHGYRRFAERHGFHLSNTEIMRHLELPVEEDLLDVTPSTPVRSGRTRIVSRPMSGECPSTCRSRSAPS